MKNQKGVSLVALIITIIVIIILAAIVMRPGGEAIDQGQFAGYAQEFGEYTDAVTTSALDVKADTAIEGHVINAAQMNYMLANGVKATAFSGSAANGMMVPSGDEIPAVILYALGYQVRSGDTDLTYWQKRVPAYEIKDDRFVEGYDKKEFDFYGNSNGDEKHYVTSDGKVFTLPGFPQTQEDKSIRYYINANQFYTVQGQSDKIKAADPNVMTNTGKIVAAPIVKCLDTKVGLAADASM